MRYDEGDVHAFEDAMVSFGGVLDQLEQVFFYYPRLKRVKDHVQNHLRDRVALADAAGVAAYDPSYFCKWFHTHVGITFVQWMKLCRVQSACMILSGRYCSIAELADATGFQSVRTFERAFKSVIGIPPQAFRHLVRSLRLPHG
ncbi:MAG TPA: AraC family transcriptional regulator [Candidatus Binatia bacterium]|nr:AraC family transcriptional regulator [Candidatus Binatia bacterium]